jgi:hypothetical protein
MKKILNLFLVLFISFICFFPLKTIAYTDSQIDNVYYKSTLKLDKRYNNIDLKLSYLKKLDLKIDSILKKKNLSSTTRHIIERLSYLNKNYIKKLEKKDVYKTFNDIAVIDLSSQKRIEKKVLDFLLKKTKSLKKPNYIIDLLNT